MTPGAAPPVTAPLGDRPPRSTWSRGTWARLGRIKLLTAQAEVALADRVEAGVFAAERLRRVVAGNEILPQLRPGLRKIERACRRRPRHPDRGQPPAGRLDRRGYAGHGLRLPGPHPGGEHPAHPRGQEVRLRQGLQVLHLRHVVDPPGRQPGTGRAEPHVVRVPVHVIEQLRPARPGPGASSCETTAAAQPRQRLAHSWGTTPARVEELQHLAHDPISLDQTLGDEGYPRSATASPTPHAASPSTPPRPRSCTTDPPGARWAHRREAGSSGSASASPTGAPAARRDRAHLRRARDGSGRIEHRDHDPAAPPRPRPALRDHLDAP